jgi:hypothetical protein
VRLCAPHTLHFSSVPVPPLRPAPHPVCDVISDTFNRSADFETVREIKEKVRQAARTGATALHVAQAPESRSPFRFVVGPTLRLCGRLRRNGGALPPRAPEVSPVARTPILRPAPHPVCYV